MFEFFFDSRSVVTPSQVSLNHPVCLYDGVGASERVLNSHFGLTARRYSRVRRLRSALTPLGRLRTAFIMRVVLRRYYNVRATKKPRHYQTIYGIRGIRGCAWYGHGRENITDALNWRALLHGFRNLNRS